MGSDRARISFDRTREYRSLVAQQGRVTLEADVNEQAVIASEALRLETIDIVGPTGTPDDGYGVSIGAGGQVTVGHGIMYVGGWRMWLGQDVPVAKQPEWIDQPDWTLGGQKPLQGDSVIALLVTEQEVQAVEDQALLEVALGGPDTAARTRLMQHIVAVPTTDDTCAAVLKDWNRTLKPLGLALNPDSFALDFNAALEVSFYPPAGPADPCCPPAQGGYLGSDNQLVRVTVTSYNSATHSGTLLWGWNNASFLYRAAFVDPTANPLVLTLSPAPVDPAHTPQLSQVIELLRSTMVLGNPADQNFVAAPEGDVITLASAGTVFDPTTNQLTLPAGTVLPAGYATDKNQLFVRLWQAEVDFNDGVAVQLDAVSGLAVTIHMDALATGPLEARPFWDFAVRPNTPQKVYPQRYQQGPQGPTGPRRWLADLAIVEYIPGAAPKMVADCRVHFPSTEDDCGCCGITLTPAQVTARGGLQAVVDAQAKVGQTLSLRPGTYILEAPLALTKAHTGFSLSSCEPGRARLTVDAAKAANFTSGMITMQNASNITLEGLVFSMPLINDSALSAPIDAVTGLQLTADIAMGVGLEDAETVTIEDCQFVFPNSAAGAQGNLVVYFGAGIYASGNCSGLRVLGNRFQCSGGGQVTADSYRMLIGLAMAPDAQSQQGDNNTDSALANAYLPQVSDSLDDVEILDNRFTGLSVAGMVIAEMGMIRCNSNRVANCCGGFWFLDSNFGSNIAFGQSALTAEQQGTGNASDAYTARQVMQPVFLANAVRFSYAVRQSAAKSNAPANSTISAETRTVLSADYTEKGSAAYTAFTTSNDGAAAAGEAQQAPAEGQPAAQAQEVAPAESAAPAPAPNQVDYANAAAAYGSLVNVGLAKELAGSALVPALSIRDNDIVLVPYRTTADHPASLQGIRCMLSLNAPTGALFLSGNRVEAPNGYSIAVSSEWAADAVITGNIFNQKGVEEKAEAPCAVLAARERDLWCITGNVVNADWKVSPARFGVPAVATWKFLNTVL